MASEIIADPDLDWLDHVQPVGVVVAPILIKEMGLTPIRQTPIDTGLVAELLESDAAKPALRDPWKFFQAVLGWEARHVAGAPDGRAMPPELLVALPEHDTVLQPTWAVAELGEGQQPWQLLIRIEPVGVDADTRGTLDGWEATPRQRFERLLRGTGVFAGILITDHTLNLIYAPRGETSGHLTFPLRALGTVAGRPMLSGLKLLLDRFRLFSDADDRRLRSILARSRDAQASVSSTLADQVLGALHELLRGLDGAEPDLVRHMAKAQPDHLYEGLLTVLMRLVFILYAEDRDLLPSRVDGRAREIYESSYSVRGLFARLNEDAALNPDTMDERRGGWGRLLALFRLVQKGHPTRFVQARGGKLFDPDEFLFLEGRISNEESPRILRVSDGCLLRVLAGLMTLKMRGGTRERLSYRTLDVEQIGSVYETVIGFTVQTTAGRAISIKAGKNNRIPVFVDLDELLRKKGKDRARVLKENAGRSQISASQAKSLESAASVEELAASLDGIVDDRGTPRRRVIPLGAPILQPTDERRRTGSYYTPRSLTAPIVKSALGPAFDRLGDGATPEQVLDLCVCDPAMGSGAFLVEACRTIGERLVRAWAQWPEMRPIIPADEDEELHARRLVAQRCLYGVDRNPRAVDLARLSLWLATLARDHEFTFLDHALKCGDSLVGLSRVQITSLHWHVSGVLPLFRDLVRERSEAAINTRREIREAPDDEARIVQESRFQDIEGQLYNTRLIGAALIAAYLSSEKPKERERTRQQIEIWANGPVDEMWSKLKKLAATLQANGRELVPFHWEIEFPEVFERENGGFDSVIGNPPFLGGSYITRSFGSAYFSYLTEMYPGCAHHCDYVGYFVRRMYSILRNDAVMGVIATKTIAQGDTREGTLQFLLESGAQIIRARRAIVWPGEASVVVVTLHIKKGLSQICASLDGEEVSRISAFLVRGDVDSSPVRLLSNPYMSEGSKIYGKGFLFDDDDSASNPTSLMDEIVAEYPALQERILPFIGGDEINSRSDQAPHRYVIFLSDFKEEYELEAVQPLARIVREMVLPERLRLRDTSSARQLKRKWWAYQAHRPRLYAAAKDLRRVLVNSLVSSHLAFVFVASRSIFSHKLGVIPTDQASMFTCVQSRPHELWARFLSTSGGEGFSYSPTDCFSTFPFPPEFESNHEIRVAGEGYHAFRSQLMTDRNEGLTKAYNRFHAQSESDQDIVRLRMLHNDLDIAVLRGYGWDDLAARAAPVFVNQEVEEEVSSSRTRLDWPFEFKDEVLSRLLALNVERSAVERTGELTSLAEEPKELENDDDGATA